MMANPASFSSRRPVFRVATRARTCWSVYTRQPMAHIYTRYVLTLSTHPHTIHTPLTPLTQLSCTGTIDHRLTVQGNDQIFQSTKDRMKQVEQKRKETMTQEIKLPTKGDTTASCYLGS